jgi:hypothetical protein
MWQQGPIFLAKKLLIPFTTPPPKNFFIIRIRQKNKSLSGLPIFHLPNFSQFHQICPGSSWKAFLVRVLNTQYFGFEQQLNTDLFQQESLKICLGGHVFY